jgi:aromatic-L-amino-acid/L-tryptophan decarboxylase
VIGYTADSLFHRMLFPMSNPPSFSLDPVDWSALRGSGHQMLDDMFDYLEHIRERPVWQPIPESIRHSLDQSIPQQGMALDQVYQHFLQQILPYSIGNAHPGFMGWVHGGGTPVGMLAELLAAGLNANLGGRNQMPVVVERQILAWLRELFSFPSEATGLFVTGSSMANFIAVIVARTRALGQSVRLQGLNQHLTAQHLTAQHLTAQHLPAQQLTAYTSVGAHGCVSQAMDISGIGSSHLRQVVCNARFEIDINALRQVIRADRDAGLTPFLIVGSAGTVDTGAIDDLNMLADLAQQEQCWFHVDGAYGALAMMSPQLAPKLAGIERADSIAMDFHKWAQVQYDAGFILVRDGVLHHDTFASPATYLRRDTRGAAADSPWPCDYGPDLSRGFRALKAWFTLKTYGTERLGQVMAGTCELASYLAGQITLIPELELLAPVNLNIVCFRYCPSDPMSEPALNQLNSDLIIALHESGISVPSATTINGQLAIRAALFNHRTEVQDIDALLVACLRFGAELIN